MEPTIDPEHWLYRLDAPQWLSAARGELERSYTALRSKQHRPGLAHARRAAGMAINALLVRHADERYGRSYMEHLAALAADDTADPPVREAAAALRSAPIQQAPVISLGFVGSVAFADAGALILEHVAEVLGRADS